jgi:hypothetical protein
MFISFSSKFEVQSSKSSACLASPEFVSAEFGRTQVFHKTGNDAAHLHGLIVERLELFICDILFVQSDIKLVSEFAARTFGIGQELNEFAVAFTFKTAPRTPGYSCGGKREKSASTLEARQPRTPVQLRPFSGLGILEFFSSP